MSETLKMKLMGKPVPTYSKGEEIFNWVSHAIGALIGYGALIAFVALSITNDFSALEISSLIIYSASIMFLYLCSTIYHIISPNSPYKRVFRVLDHNTIYVLIAGTYLPICAMGFPGTNFGLIMLIIELSGLVIGTILNLVNINNNFIKVFTVILYVVMGWLAVFFMPAFLMLDFDVRMLILFGGIAYTVGVIFYALGKKKKWMHSVFHLFVLVGTIIQLAGIFCMLNLF